MLSRSHWLVTMLVFGGMIYSLNKQKIDILQYALNLSRFNIHSIFIAPIWCLSEERGANLIRTESR
jgi:hypothetical protein